MAKAAVRCPMCGSADLVPEGGPGTLRFIVGMIGVPTSRSACGSCGYVLTRIADAAAFRQARAVRGWGDYFRYMKGRMDWRRRRRASRGQCLACGYDLRGSPDGGCPECGAGRRDDADRDASAE